jgi:5'-methylthioadenosine phosphorylase
MCYACLACVTDYDTWHDDHAAVTVDLVLANLQRNVETARGTVALLAGGLPDPQTCACCASLATAIVTSLDLVSEQRKRDLAPILQRYGPPA